MSDEKQDFCQQCVDGVKHSHDSPYNEFVKGIDLWNQYSQFCEDSIIQAIFDKIGIENKWCCEVGAGDGLFFSNTRRLIERAWNAVLIESDEKIFRRLVQNIGPSSSSPSIFTFNETVVGWGNPIGEYVVGNTLDAILGTTPTPVDLDLMIIDVDGQDYYLFNSLVKYRPRVLLVEYNPGAIDPMFIPLPGGIGQAGHEVMSYVANARGYEVICATQCNLICVRRDIAPKLLENPGKRFGKFGDSVSDQRMWPKRSLYPIGQYLESLPEEERAKWNVSHNADPLPNFFRPPYNNYLEDLEAEDRKYLKSPDSYYKILCNEQLESMEAAEQEKPPILEFPVDAKQNVKVAACMSTPRFGPLANSDCAFEALSHFGINLARGEGAWWHHCLTRAIELSLEAGADFILTIDYDTAYNHTDIAKLVSFLLDNPEIDVAVPMMQKREQGEMLATSFGQVDLTQPGIPIRVGHFGLTLFRRRTFAKLAKPWFYEKPSPDGGWNSHRVDADMGFWQNCVDHEIWVYLVLTTVVGHLEQVVTWPDQYLKPYHQNINQWRQGQMKRPEQVFKRELAKETMEKLKEQPLNMKD